MMIDFHTHILPGVDDGSDSVGTSLAMLREERRQGVEAVVLTPHFYAGENSPRHFLEKREAAWRELSGSLDEDCPRLYLGAEVQYFEGICSVEGIRELCLEGSDILLLEMPFCRWSQRMLDDVAALNEMGMQVVLAHIERYLGMQPRETWQHLRETGVWMQANLSFFHSWKTRHRALKMLSRGQIQFLGSDCHNMTSRSPKWEQLPSRVLPLLQESGPYAGFCAGLLENV